MKRRLDEMVEDGNVENAEQPVESGETGDVEETGEQEPVLPFPVVAIGGSAGGVEAFIELFENVPPDTGMAMVVLQHLAPDQPSFLPDILARKTSTPVSAIASGMRPEPNHVYVLPANAQASLNKGVFHLKERLLDVRFRPIDFFFESLASEQKNFAIGIVLSGMDSDGAIGLRAIKGESGIAIVQAPESARFPEMPRSSISGDHVDMVLPPTQIGWQLGELGKRFRNPEFLWIQNGDSLAEEEKDFGRVIKLLRGVSGVDFQLYKPTTIRRRLARRMLMHRSETLADYVSLLMANPKEVRDLQEDILINVTRFFRDPDVFDALKCFVFPKIFEDRDPDQPVRVWVAGCSSGEEVYSIAICLLEFRAGNALEPGIQIFGTDASEQNIQRARLGIYTESIAGDVSPERLRRFFVKTDKGYQVSKRVRDMCIFARQNLCNDPPFSRLDLVSCRNILIYFGAQLQSRLIPTFHYALRQEGFLLLGSSETIRNTNGFFRLADRRHKIYVKQGSTPVGALKEAMPQVLAPNLASSQFMVGSGEPAHSGDLQRAADRIVLARYGPPGVVVNEKLEILQSRGQTAPFLQMAQGAASLQLTRMLQESIASPVMMAVRRAIEENVPVQVDKVQIRENGEIREAIVEVFPMHGEPATSNTYLVLFVPPVRNIGASEPAESQLESGEDAQRTLTHLKKDLSSTKLHLQSLLDERDARTQDLVSANEEIQSANEELQSTNEELETTKEELQSSNEELQTVNDELQNQNNVLTQATNDLSNLLNSVNLPVLMLSSDLSIRHFTPQMQRLMNVRPTDIGRPFADIRLNLNIEHLEDVFAEILDTLGSRELEVQDRAGHWYLLRVRPYRTAENKIDGLVVVLVDIDQLRRSQQELREARDLSRSIFEHVPLPLVVANFDLHIRSVNQAFLTLAGSSKNVLEGRYLPDFTAALWDLDEPLRSVLETLRNNKEDAKSFEFKHRTTQETPRVLLVSGGVLQPDGEQFLLVSFQDITSHDEAERLSRTERERLAEQVKITTEELERSREDLRALTANLLTTQEEERRRLARELHDDVIQRIAVLSMDIDEAVRILGENPEGAVRKLQETSARISHLSQEVRGLSHRLHPSVLEDLGLAMALRSLTEDFGEREDMITTFYAEEVPPALSFEVATALYRIAQEALRNVAKHAGKTHVKVMLTGTPEVIEMQIADAGHGFQAGTSRSGLGLISMQERVRPLGGAVTVQSASREGTKVTVRIPLSTDAGRDPVVQ